jgi:alanine dehydrogenase
METMTMIIGVPKEIKENEYRVALTPAGANALTKRRHTVLVERGAGLGSGFSDSEYREAGAKIVSDAEAVWRRAEMIMKVKEPLPVEHPRIREGQIVFTYFHFAADARLTKGVLKRNAICIAYETVEKADRSLPLLTPMSEVAGKLSVQEGAKYLEAPMGGRGVLLGGVPGTQPARVLVIGGGVVGTAAAKVAAGMGAEVTIMDLNLDRLRYLDDVMPANVTTLMSNPYNIASRVQFADLVVGAVLVVGAKAPRLVTKRMLKTMKPGSVIVDVAIDQGGCFETSKPTTHGKPIYVVDGVVHYCVANMPGAVARTSTYALTNATLPYALQIAGKGFPRCCKENRELLLGLNMCDGHITYDAVAKAFGLPFSPAEKFLGRR